MDPIFLTNILPLESELKTGALKPTGSTQITKVKVHENREMKNIND